MVVILLLNVVISVAWGLVCFTINGLTVELEVSVVLDWSAVISVGLKVDVEALFGIAFGLIMYSLE